jgi:hypothetical protein
MCAYALAAFTLLTMSAGRPGYVHAHCVRLESESVPGMRKAADTVLEGRR